MQHFFSYSRKDKDFVTKLFHDLEAQNCDVWLDTLDLQAGAKWDRSVEDALAKAQSLIVILSPASVRSENVMDEVSYALDKGKLVIPVIMEQCEVPLRLRRLQHIDFTANSYNEALDTLVSRIKKNEISPAKNSSHEPIQMVGETSLFRRLRMPALTGVALLALVIVLIWFSDRDKASDTTAIAPPAGVTLMGACDEEIGMYYEYSGNNIIFQFTIKDTGTNVAVFVDVNANHQVDYNIDREYSTTIQDSRLVLCTEYMPGKGKCDAPSKAFLTNENDTVKLSIPLSELTTSKDAKQILVELLIYDPSMFCKLPAGTTEDLSRTFSINLP
jgi:hypothetical protein